MEITARNGRWNVTMDWPEAHEAYDEEGSPAERAIAAVARHHDVAREHLRSSIIRANEEGMTVVVESNG
jgi:transposase-like protein